MEIRTTEHLILRDFQESDIDLLYEIQGNRDFMRYTFWAQSRKACADNLRTYAFSKTEHGFAPWTVLHEGDARIIGWGGLNIDPADPRWGPEVSYFIHPDYSGQGLATELAREAVAYGFSEVGLKEINAFARPENKASIRVLGKVGFKRSGHVTDLERDRFVIQY